MAWNVSLPDAEFYSTDDVNLGQVVADVMRQPLVAIDTETTGLTVWRDLPLFFSLAWGNRRMCLPAEALPRFHAAFQDPEKEWVFANAKFDLHMLANAGIHIAGRILDTQVMHALLYEAQPHSLDHMGKQLLGWSWKDMFETWDKRNQPNVGDFILGLFHNDRRRLVEYASNDAFGTLRIYEKLSVELKETRIYSLYPERYKTLWDYFIKVESPFTRVLWKCERNGILIDSRYLEDISYRVTKEMNTVERDLTREVGYPINMNSPKQLREYFFDKLGLRPISFTEGGRTGVKLPRVDDDFLRFYAPTVPAAKLMLLYREMAKLKGTYTDGLPRFFDRHGRIHTRFNQDVARTGRLSSSEPNLQNIPNAEADEHKVRAAFISPPGMDLIAVDYQALEMRLLAAASMETSMIEVFNRGWDIHMGNASMVYNIPYDDIKAAKAKKENKEPLTDYDKKCLKARADVKAVSFGLNYGMKEKLLAKNLGCTKEEALELMGRYMGRYPAVQKFYEEAIKESRKSGYAYTVLGRRRFLPEIVSYSQYDRWQAERQATNLQIQGSAADAAKMAMILIDDAQIEQKYGARMLLQIHDEIVFECPEETADEALKEISMWMEHPFPTDLAVALTVSGGRAKNWAEAK